MRVGREWILWIAILCVVGLARGQEQELVQKQVVSTRSTSSENAVWRNESWSSFLPRLAEEAYEQGYELPLPFGVGFNFVTLKRDIELKKIRAGLGNLPLKDVTDLVAADITTYVDTLILRGDVWIFPFLNIYVMGGYLNNPTEIKADFILPTGIGPGAGTTNVSINVRDELSGSLVGGGITMAAGYDDYFLSLDMNYSLTQLDGVVDEKIEVIIYSMRTGWNGQIGHTLLQLWVGGMYWDSEREVTGSSGPVKFAVVQGPKDPFNLTLGTNIELSRSIQLMTEYAFNFDDLRMLTVGATYRF